jgi:hypothetical protein
MATWWVGAHTLHGVPYEADADLAPLLWAEKDGVKLTNYKSVIDESGRLELEFTVEAEDEAGASERTYEWLANLCRNGHWLNDAGVSADFDSDDPDADFTEVQEVFGISGVSPQKA